MRRLPPFPELVAFEAVARLMSFTKAAAELCVTQSAVSHRVRRLEKFFGTQLIVRLNPGLKLTESGAELFAASATILESLSKLGARTKKRERRLRVAAGSALCTWWLAGRLASFMQQRPAVSIELVPIENDATAIPHVDVRILWVEAGQDAPSATQTPLFSEYVFPVCSPRLLPRGEPLRDSRALGKLPLLHKATNSSGEWSWPVWFNRLGAAADAGTARELRFADSGLMLAAAIEGSGVALSRSLLAYDSLRTGALIVPVSGFEPIVSSKKHIARWRRDSADDADIKAFANWLVAEAAVTIANSNELLRAMSAANEFKKAEKLAAVV